MPEQHNKGVGTGRRVSKTSGGGNDQRSRKIRKKPYFEAKEKKTLGKR